MDSGQWTVDSEQRTVESGQRVVRRIADKRTAGEATQRRCSHEHVSDVSDRSCLER